MMTSMLYSADPSILETGEHMDDSVLRIYNFQSLIADLAFYRFHGKLEYALHRLAYYFAPPEIP